MMAPFVCEVVKVHDGDGPVWCRNGIKVRIAGVQAPDFESAAPCRRPPAQRRDYVCDDAKAKRSQQLVERLVLHKRLTCRPVGRSRQRVVARCNLPDGRSLTCATIASGAATRWDTWWKRYKLEECR